MIRCYFNTIICCYGAVRYSYDEVRCYDVVIGCYCNTINCGYDAVR